MIYSIMILGNTTDDDDDGLNLVPYRSITPCADPLQTQQTPYSTRDPPSQLIRGILFRIGKCIQKTENRKLEFSKHESLAGHVRNTDTLIA